MSDLSQLAHIRAGHKCRSYFRERGDFVKVNGDLDIFGHFIVTKRRGGVTNYETSCLRTGPYNNYLNYNTLSTLVVMVRRYEGTEF